MRLSKLKSDLLSECKKFAVQLLEEQGEFFPFAFGILSDNTIVSVAPDSDDNSTNSLHIIDSLEEAFYHLHPKRNFIAVCICLDVFLLNETGSRSNALEIRVDVTSEKCSNVYFVYKVTKGKIEFEDPYELTGSFPFFEHIKFDRNVYTLKSIIDNQDSILYVIHDNAGNWQFLNGEELSEDNLTMLKFKDLLLFDPSIEKLKNMKIGYEAIRENINSDWNIFKIRW